MQAYQIFNRVLKSVIELPELGKPVQPFEGDTISFDLCASSFCADINWYHDWVDEQGRKQFSAGRDQACFYLRFPGVANFRLEPAMQRIECHCPQQVEPALLRHLLLDQVLPRLLSLCHCSVIHASAFELDGEIVALGGPSGAGKSTLAGAFAEQGFSLLTDDCLLLEPGRQRVEGVVSYAGLRLWPDSHAQLGHASEAGEALSEALGEHTDKRRIVWNPGTERAGKVRALFILESPEAGMGDEAVSVEALTGAGAVMALLQNSFRMDFSANEEVAAIARMATLVDSGLALYRLTCPHDYARLSEVRETLLRVLQ